MFKRITRLTTTAALVVVALAACDQAPGPTEVIMPVGEPASPYVVDYTLYDSELSVESASLYSTVTGARLAETDAPVESEVATAIIGPEGGSLSTTRNTLQVPPNAVSHPTEFTLEVVGGNHILVDLSARTVNGGQTVSQFPVPLTLTLGYRGLIKNGQVNRLRNVYLFLDSPSYLVPLFFTVNKSDKSLSSPIWHFSQYGMAIE